MAYKKENQYTTLIHEGENVTIDPPGVINAEGGEGGGGLKPEDLQAPFSLFNRNGETVGKVTMNGDVHLDGTVYINATDGEEGTDIQELSPIFDIDIIGDYENGTFTSSQTFAEIAEALETGHTLIARDTNGFVYAQTGSEFDPESTDTITFATNQPDGIYLLNWTGTNRIISFIHVGGAGEGSITYLTIGGSTSGTINSEDLSKINTAISNNEFVVLRIDSSLSRGGWYIYQHSTSTQHYFSGAYVDAYGILKNISLNKTTGSWVSKTITTVETPQKLYTNGTYINSTINPSSNMTGGSMGTIMKSQFGASAKKIMLWYTENGKHHLLRLNEKDGDNPDASASTFNGSYKFTCTEPYSQNTLIVYEGVITVTNQSQSLYSFTFNTYTYTIGS